MSISNGAGSGYIGNSLVSAKKMVGYNVPTSSAEGTKTISVNTYSADATANTPKSGNGHARITWLREIPPVFEGFLEDIVKTTDINHVQFASHWTSNYGLGDINNDVSAYIGTDYILSARQSSNNGNYFSSFDGNEGQGYNRQLDTGCLICLPIPRKRVAKIKFKAKVEGSTWDTQYAFIYGALAFINGNNKLQFVLAPTNYGIVNLHSWTECTYTLPTPHEVDYVVFYVCDTKWFFKDFEFYN